MVSPQTVFTYHFHHANKLRSSDSPTFVRIPRKTPVVCRPPHPNDSSSCHSWPIDQYWMLVYSSCNIHFANIYILLISEAVLRNPLVVNGSEADQAYGGQKTGNGISVIKVHTFTLVLWYIEKKLDGHCCRLSLSEGNEGKSRPDDSGNKCRPLVLPWVITNFSF